MQCGGVGVAPEALQRCSQIAAGGALFGEQVVDDGDRLLGREALVAADGDAFGDLERNAAAHLYSAAAMLETSKVSADSIVAEATPILFWIRGELAIGMIMPGLAARTLVCAISMKASNAPCAIPKTGETSAVGPKVVKPNRLMLLCLIAAPGVFPATMSANRNIRWSGTKTGCSMRTVLLPVPCKPLVNQVS